MKIILVLSICLLFFALLFIGLYLHEMSHVYSMKRCKIKVDYGKVGMGPTLFKFRQQDISVTVHLNRVLECSFFCR